MLTRLAIAAALLATLNASADKPAGWQFVMSPEGRQADTPKRGYLLLGDTSFTENDPAEAGVKQQNLTVTTTTAVTEMTLTLNAQTAANIETALDFLWTAIPAASNDSDIYRLMSAQSSMRVYEENALRKAEVSIQVSQLYTTGGAKL